jgi:hypothetical protein
VTEVDFDWDQCDSSEAKETVVLLGSGASADLGIPTSALLHNELVTRLDPLYVNLARLVFPNGPVDVERLFRVIQFLHTVETANRPDDRRLAFEEPDLAKLVATWKDSIGQYLDSDKHTVKGSETGLLIDAIWRELLNLLWLPLADPPDIRYLRWLLKTMTGGTVVTLNYDNSLESAASMGAGLGIDVGPYPGPRDGRTPGFNNSPDAVRIVKLHGSLNWTTDPSTGDVRVLDHNDVATQNLTYQAFPLRPPAPGIIFGAGNKLRPDGPYLDLYVEFKNALTSARRVIVIGYGWGDPHVNELLRRWLRYGRKLFRVSVCHGLGLPPEVDGWTQQNDHLRTEVVLGTASQKILDLTRPTPDLLRSPVD